MREQNFFKLRFLIFFAFTICMITTIVLTMIEYGDYSYETKLLILFYRLGILFFINGIIYFFLGSIPLIREMPRIQLPPPPKKEEKKDGSNQ